MDGAVADAAPDAETTPTVEALGWECEALTDEKVNGGCPNPHQCREAGECLLAPI